MPLTTCLNKSIACQRKKKHLCANRPLHVAKKSIYDVKCSLHKSAFHTLIMNQTFSSTRQLVVFQWAHHLLVCKRWGCVCEKYCQNLEICCGKPKQMWDGLNFNVGSVPKYQAHGLQTQTQKHNSVHGRRISRQIGNRFDFQRK